MLESCTSLRIRSMRSKRSIKECAVPATKKYQ
jgi:hypothetical protein